MLVREKEEIVYPPTIDKKVYLRGFIIFISMKIQHIHLLCAVQGPISVSTSGKTWNLSNKIYVFIILHMLYDKLLLSVGLNTVEMW